MKKSFIILSSALFVMSACNKTAPAEEAVGEYEIVVSASIDKNTKTAFVPDGRKVVWQKGDVIGAKYHMGEHTPTQYDNISLTLKEEGDGAGTTTAKFKGKYSSAVAPRIGDKMVFVYPRMGTQSKSGVVENYETFTIGNVFPKVQNTGTVLMDPNLMFGIGDVENGWPSKSVTTETYCETKVLMKNVMGVLDFTLKGTGAVKRLHITDNNESAQKMWGDETIKVSNGNVSEISLGEAKDAGERTIIAEFNKPIALTEGGAHAYITVLPREFSKGITVCVELTDGSYMVKKLDSKFTVDVNGYYSFENPLVFVASAEERKGYNDGYVYEYNTFEDLRNHNVYRYITAGDADWMIDNLRYIPEGHSPSNQKTDVCINGNDGDGIWYPAVLNADGNNLQFGNEGDVARVGYLYNVSLAVSGDEMMIVDIYRQVEKKDIDPQAAYDKLIKYEGNQGICPDGWIVPTMEDFEKFCTACGTTTSEGNASAFASKGFSLRDFGYFNINSNLTTTQGTLMTYAKNKLSSVVIILSTPYYPQKVDNAYKQFHSIQFDNSNNTVKTAYLNDLSGAPVRCVRRNK